MRYPIILLYWAGQLLIALSCQRRPASRNRSRNERCEAAASVSSPVHFSCRPVSRLLRRVLALVEVVVRSTLPHISTLDFFVTAPRQQAQFVDAAHVRIAEGDPLLFWRLRPNLRDVLWDSMRVTTNDQGLRYDHDVGRKPPGAFRIVCVGDSVTFGYRVPRVYLRRPRENPEWLPYPMLLERWLRAANPARRDRGDSRWPRPDTPATRAWPGCGATSAGWSPTS